MIKLNINHDLNDLRTALSKVAPDKWPAILGEASNETAFYVRNKLKDEMPKHIDRPKPFTINSLFVIKAGSKKEVDAVVLWRPGSVGGNSAGRYLKPMAEGANRDPKRFEKLLAAKGMIPPNTLLIPVKGAIPLDPFGNVPGPFITKLISGLRAFEGSLGMNKNRRSSTGIGGMIGKKVTKRMTAFFTVQKVGSRLLPGIYERRDTAFGGAIRKIFNFTDKATYKKAFPFEAIASAATKEKFPLKINEAIDKAMKK